MTRLPRRLSTAVVMNCLAILLSIFSMAGHAQETPNPVGEFLNAFRGKPVGPVAPPPPGSAQTVGGPSSATTSAPLTSTTAAQAPVPGSVPSCPPGVERLGCPRPLSQQSQNNCPAGMTAGPTGCVPMAMPPNAHRVSTDGQWQCDDGYMRFGAVCMALQSTPANAHLTGTGTDWECNSGFRRIGNACEAVSLPPNSHLANTGNGWECDSGFRMVGNFCVGH